jgi:riboflavin synthase
MPSIHLATDSHISASLVSADSIIRSFFRSAKMFTGLVETIGTVTSLVSLDSSTSGGNGTSLTISDCSSILTDAVLGDSICVNGTCLTVTELSSGKDHFKVGVAPETLRRTNLGSLKEGSRVNLERAVLGSTRMGGHFVQGHVDTIATIESVTPDGNALTFRLKPREKEVLRYIVEKGYITLDGASLTITKVNDEEGWFEVMLIAYTQERVVMASKKAGEGVNVEIDLVGKLVEKSVVGYFEGRSGTEGAPAMLEKIVGRLVDEKLKAAKL